MTFCDLTIYNLQPPTDQTLYRTRPFYRILSGFHRTFATGVACRQGTLTPSGHLVLSHLGFAFAHQTETTLHACDVYRIWLIYRNVHYRIGEVSTEYMQRAWHASRGRWLLRSPGPVPLGLAYVLLLETNTFPNFSLFYRTMLFEYPSILSRFCLVLIWSKMMRLAETCPWICAGLVIDNMHLVHLLTLILILQSFIHHLELKHPVNAVN